MTAPLDDEELARITRLVEAARQRLVTSEEETARLQRLVDSVLDVVPPLVAVEQGTIVAWSAALEERTGVPAVSAVGRPLARVLPDVRAVGDGVLQVVLDGGATWSLESDAVAATLR